MIVGQGTMDGDRLILLGVTAENVERLVRDRPIVLSRATHGPGIPDGWRIVIVYGADEASLARKLRPALDPGVKVYEEPRLEDPPRQNS